MPSGGVPCKSPDALRRAGMPGAMIVPPCPVPRDAIVRANRANRDKIVTHQKKNGFIRPPGPSVFLRPESLAVIRCQRVNIR